MPANADQRFEKALNQIRELLQNVDPDFYPQLVECLQGHVRLVQMVQERMEQ